MKKLKFSLCSSLFAFCFATFSAFCVSAQNVFTAIVNPGEDATTQVRINWHSELEAKDTYLYYTSADDTDWKSAKRIEPLREQCNVFDGMYSKTADGVDYYERARFIRNVAAIDGLQPGTKYMYRLGETSVGDVRYFSTLPDTGTWTAAIISDFHAYSPLPNRTKAAMDMLAKLKEVNGEDFDMILHVGDIAAWGGSYS